MIQVSAPVRAHLAAVADHAATLPNLVEATRHMMGNYSLNGVERPLVCESWRLSVGGVDSEWFLPAGGDAKQRILYLHGGGWISGSIDTHRHLIDALAGATGRAVLAINYRLAPENPFPKGLEDCGTALEWIAANGPDGASAATHVTVAGDSAGGNLAATTTVRALSRRDRRPDALVLLAPVTDIRASAGLPIGLDDPVVRADNMAALCSLYLDARGRADDPLASPITAPDELLGDFPKTLIQVGSDEFLRDQSIALAGRLWNRNVPVQLSVWANMPHVFQMFPQELPQAARAFREIAEFLTD